MRLFRTILLLSAAGLLLPSPPEDLAKGSDADSPSTIGKLEGKLLYSASLLWGWAWDGRTGKPKLQGPYATVTVEGDMPPPATNDPKGQSTLGLDDLVPPWRGAAKEG